DGPSGGQGDDYNSSGRVDAGTEDDSATVDVVDVIPGSGNNGGGDNGGSSTSGERQPNCTRSDGTPDFLTYQGLQHTTIEEQRTEIRPEEQRPGVYLHTYCGDEWLGFDFYPEEEGQPTLDP